MIVMDLPGDVAIITGHQKVGEGDGLDVMASDGLIKCQGLVAAVLKPRSF